MTIRLRDLDGRSVAVSLSIQDRPTLLTGVGTYCSQCEFGPCLRIACRDLAGEFEIVVRDQGLPPKILPGSSSSDADFTLIFNPPAQD